MKNIASGRVASRLALLIFIVRHAHTAVMRASKMRRAVVFILTFTASLLSIPVANAQYTNYQGWVLGALTGGYPACEAGSIGGALGCACSAFGGQMCGGLWQYG